MSAAHAGATVGNVDGLLCPRGVRPTCLVSSVACAKAAPLEWPPGVSLDPERKDLAMDLRLELVVLPVSDVDRSKAFYVDQFGFNADHDHVVTPNSASSS